MSELDEYDYDLPTRLIAQQPLPNRADARLLVVDRQHRTLAHHHIRDLPDLLRPGDCLVLNDSRVVPARLIGRREETGGRWEGLFLEADAAGNWRLLGKTRGKIAAGEHVVLIDRLANDALRLRLVARGDEGEWLARPLTSEPAHSILERIGRVPLPPYIRGGDMLPSDMERYQTVYARHPGSVAAPTAGLHFTPALLDALTERGVGTCHVTLHVGVGTFRPIAAPRLAEHRMHYEMGVVGKSAVDTLMAARDRGGRRVAVGTTSMRLLETAAASGTLVPWEGETNLFIKPGHQFRAVDAMLTNFHLPRSTLLVLVRTFGGDSLIRRAYDEAIRDEYRFFSYGDAMLIL